MKRSAGKSDVAGSVAKRRPEAAAAAEDGAEAAGDTGDETQQALKRLAEDNQFTKADTRKLAQALDRKVKRNQELRIKFADDPLKFMDSEVELHEELRTFSVAATAPQFYSCLVEGGTPAILVGLLQHENTDLSCAAITAIQELTDTEALEDNPEHARVLIDALLKEDLFKQLLPLLDRLDEDQREEAEAIHNALGVVENMVELSPDLNEKLVASTNILPWLLKRVQKKAFDANKLYASELLAVFTQTSEANRTRFGTEGGIDVILRALSAYKKADPSSDEEAEMIENLFDVLCSSIMVDDNRLKFLEAEGVELMCLMLRTQNICRFGAMRTIDFAMAPSRYSAMVADKFVERLGLKTLFPCFMKTPKLKSLKGTTAQFEEHVCTIIASLLRDLPPGEARDRVLGKFVEQDLEKCVRLAELHAANTQKLRACDAKIARDIQAMEAAGEAVDEAVETDIYLQRIDNGLGILQLVDYITAEVIVGCAGQMQAEVEKIFRAKGANLSELHDILIDYADNVGDEAKGEEQSFALRLRKLADTIVPAQQTS